MKRAIAKKRSREDTPQQSLLAFAGSDDCLMFFCCFYSSFSCKFCFYATARDDFTQNYSFKKKKKHARQNRESCRRCSYTFDRKRALEKMQKRKTIRESNKHTLTPILWGVNLATVCTLLQLKLSFSN